jgi:hypothetical protein
MHHFGLASFFNAGEHWVLQASLPHSISDELAGPSFASALDTLAFVGFWGAGVVGADVGCAGVASLSGFSRSKFPVSAHAARARASDKANSHFILSPRRAEPARILPQHALATGGKRNGLERRVADLLISDRDGTKRPLLGHRRTCGSAAHAANAPHATRSIMKRRRRFSKIGNLQQLAVTDPGFRQISLGFARRVGVAACLIQFSQSVV